jgi:hypothetical protein
MKENFYMDSQNKGTKAKREKKFSIASHTKDSKSVLITLSIQAKIMI